MIRIGPYRFTDARYIHDGERDWLRVDNGPGTSVTGDGETSDGDVWFYPDDESTEPGGVDFERARDRFQRDGKLTVELPDGKRVEVEGAAAYLAAVPFARR